MEKRENQNQNQEREKTLLEKFQQEIQMIKEAEEKGELETGHFILKEFNIEDLTEEDRLIYKELKNGTLTKEKLREYRAAIPEGRTMRVNYAAYVANKLGIELMKKRTGYEKIKK